MAPADTAIVSAGYGAWPESVTYILYLLHYSHDTKGHEIKQRIVCFTY